MRVLFIRPRPSPETIGLQHLMVVEPLELEIMATLIMDKHEVKIADLILEKKDPDYFIHEFKPDAVCVTGYITHIPVMIECCKAAKKINPGIITIVGGVHTEQFPEDINHEAVDFRVVRNATRSFPQLIQFLADETDFPPGVLKTNENYDEARLPEYDFYVPIPDRSLTQKYRSKYFYVFHDKVALIKTSFGCPYHCNFCFCRKIAGDKYIARPLDDVIEELNSIREKEVYIVDDDFLCNIKRVNEFLRLVKESGIKKRYLVYGRADFIAQNPSVIREFKEAGLRTVIVGLESFDDRELEGFNKQTDSDINRQAMEVLNRYGVDCYAAVIVSPSWGPDDFKVAGDIMKQLGIKFVNLQPLTPLKGTGINVNEEELLIKRVDYTKWDLAHVSIRPEKMSLQDYYKSILDLYFRIVLSPRNLISHLRYPIKMQWRMATGTRKVRNQYQRKIMETAENA